MSFLIIFPIANILNSAIIIILKFINLISFQAVMAALRNLQQRIRQLEIERAEAEANMNDLSIQASNYR